MKSGANPSAVASKGLLEREILGEGEGEVGGARATEGGRDGARESVRVRYSERGCV